MKLKNQGKGLGGLVLLSFFLAPGVQAVEQPAEANWYLNLNRAIMNVDDGYEKNTFFVDNFSKTSRAGITGEKAVDSNLKFGGKLELEFVTASTYSVNQLDRTAYSSSGTSQHDGVKIRHVDTWLKGAFGQLSLGHGSMASWTVVSSDLSDTADTIGYLGPWGMAGGMYFHDKASTATVAGTEPKVSAVFSPYDGLARKDRIRYDSPSFAGFTLSGSIASEDKYKPTGGANISHKYATDIALRYNGTIQDIKLLGALSFYKFSKWQETRTRKVTDASIAVLHEPTGINAAVNFAASKLGTETYPVAAAAGQASRGVSKTQKFHRAQLGWKANLNCYGSTNFVADYTHSKHTIENDSKGKAYGLGVEQQFKKINSEVYVAVRKLKLERPLANLQYNNMLAAMAGIKINFAGKLL